MKDYRLNIYYKHLQWLSIPKYNDQNALTLHNINPESNAFIHEGLLYKCLREDQLPPHYVNMNNNPGLNESRSL